MCRQGLNMSVAVAGDFIALGGVAAETGTVMLIDLDRALTARWPESVFQEAGFA
jgi:Cu/Ag efflux pump CusA